MEKIIHEVSEGIRVLACKDVPVLIALDGRCAAGKTTLAEKLHEMINCIQLLFVMIFSLATGLLVNICLKI